jgi:very-short-patch-repair endonuclease
MAKCDSKLEKSWLDLLEEWSLRLPTDAQAFITDQVWSQPDFLYKDLHVAVFIDGPPHDVRDQAEKDSEINHQLTELGFAVIRFHHDRDPAKQREAWREIFQKHPDVFGALKA